MRSWGAQRRGQAGLRRTGSDQRVASGDACPVPGGQGSRVREGCSAPRNGHFPWPSILGRRRTAGSCSVRAGGQNSEAGHVPADGPRVPCLTRWAVGARHYPSPAALGISFVRPRRRLAAGRGKARAPAAPAPALHKGAATSCRCHHLPATLPRHVLRPARNLSLGSAPCPPQVKTDPGSGAAAARAHAGEWGLGGARGRPSPGLRSPSGSRGAGSAPGWESDIGEMEVAKSPVSTEPGLAGW